MLSAGGGDTTVFLKPQDAENTVLKNTICSDNKFKQVQHVEFVVDLRYMERDRVCKTKALRRQARASENQMTEGGGRYQPTGNGCWQLYLTSFGIATHKMRLMPKGGNHALTLTIQS